MLNSGLQMKVTEGSARGSIHPLDSHTITIGRAPAGGVRQVGWVHLRDETVSGLQAELIWQPESRKFLLVNRSSTNPTKVNDLEVSEVELQTGDQIRMGRCVVDLQETDRRFVTRKSQQPVPAAVVEAPAPVATAVQTPTVTRFFLEFLEGTNAGQRLPLEAERIAVGGAFDPTRPPEDNWFDQGVALGDSSLPPYCLALVRRGQDFAMLAPREADVPAGLEREEDDLIWVAQLKPGQSVDLEADDQMRLGVHRMRVLRREVRV